MPQILAFSSSLVTLKFSIHNFLKSRLLLKILDAEFPYKLSYFEPLLPTSQDGGRNLEKAYYAALVRFEILLHVYSYESPKTPVLDNKSVLVLSGIAFEFQTSVKSPACILQSPVIIKSTLDESSS